MVVVVVVVTDLILFDQHRMPCYTWYRDRSVIQSVLSPELVAFWLVLSFVNC